MEFAHNPGKVSLPVSGKYMDSAHKSDKYMLAADN